MTIWFGISLVLPQKETFFNGYCVYFTSMFWLRNAQCTCNEHQSYTVQFLPRTRSSECRGFIRTTFELERFVFILLVVLLNGYWLNLNCGTMQQCKRRPIIGFILLRVINCKKKSIKPHAQFWMKKKNFNYSTLARLNSYRSRTSSFPFNTTPPHRTIIFFRFRTKRLYNANPRACHTQFR